MANHPHKDDQQGDPNTTGNRKYKGLCHKSDHDLKLKLGADEPGIMVKCGNDSSSQYYGYYPISSFNIESQWFFNFAILKIKVGWKW